MTIKLDEERIKAEGKYDLEKMWEKIDEPFNINHLRKEILKDGTAVYYGTSDKQCFNEMGLAYAILSDYKWFLNYCIEWIWHDGEGLPDGEFYEMDCLKEED